MKTLLVHKANYEILNKVREWAQSRNHYSDFYHLTFSLANKDQKKGMRKLKKEIAKIVDKYCIKKVFLFLDDDIVEIKSIPSKYEIVQFKQISLSQAF